MSGARDENDPLIKAAELDTKPAFVFAAHIGANVAAGNFAPIRVHPPNSSYANVRAVLDESLSSEPVQIQFQSILQANPFAWPWHSRLHVGP
jgi:hypothetical protein